jgi:hypothetical protein
MENMEVSRGRNPGASVRGASAETVPEHGWEQLVCDDHIGDSETFQQTPGPSAANAALAKVFGDPRHAEAKSAGGDSLDSFLPLLTDLRRAEGARAWKKEQRDARRASDELAAKKASASSNLIIDLKARYADEKKKQEQAEKAGKARHALANADA